MLVSPVEGSRGAFLRGDANTDAKVDAADVVVTIDLLFPGFVLIPVIAKSDPVCPDATDANDDGVRDLSDVVYLASFVFAGGAPPPAPFAGCGSDPTPDELTCAQLCD